ncbi:serine/threonine-protein kinase [Cellulomonas sp. S1-8]|uniref:serine/threonine-protein kinase n=1 Tax=Cellulomonas sp. S1-8 TaxID=2904790 RepID=UPI002243AF11|nr:serine/threonine-protein kinase [Cellulomonas sp. S1-8]UZN04057.1 serine/threonine protein kinase [Cellulomonas sp. S1-8]
MERIGLTPGSEIGGYTIVAPLGSGGMGTVYRAVDGGGHEVALKLLHPHVGSDAVVRTRLMREVAALQRLRHPAVAAVLDAEADSTEAFLVTELVAGDTLTDHVRERGTLDADDLLTLAEGLRSALAAVHAAGVVHRDLKPSNVLLTDDGPVLIDFGLAQGVDDDANLTSAGFVLGTPGYLPPELLDGSEPSAATDLWGWAALLAFAATGRDPFGSRPLEAVLARARAGQVDLEGVGPVTAAAIAGALRPDPAERTDPEDVVAALRAVAAEGDLPPGAAATVVTPGGGGGAFTAAAAVGAAGLVAAGVAAAGDDGSGDGSDDAVSDDDGPGGVVDDPDAALETDDDGDDEGDDEGADDDGEVDDADDGEVDDADDGEVDDADDDADDDGELDDADDDAELDDPDDDGDPADAEADDDGTDDLDGDDGTDDDADLDDGDLDGDDLDTDDPDTDDPDGDDPDDVWAEDALPTELVAQRTSSPQDALQTVAVGTTGAAGAMAATGGVVVAPPDPPVRDGHTVAVPVRRPAPASVPPEVPSGPAAGPAAGPAVVHPVAHDPEDPEDVDWLEDDLGDDLEEPDDLDGEEPGYVRPPARRRWGSLLALALVVALAGMLYPVVTTAVVLVLVVAVRTVGATVEAMHARRERRGVRRSDGVLAWASTPWYLLRSVLGVLPALLVGGAVVLIVTGLGWWLLGSGRWEIGGSAPGEAPQGSTATLLVGGLVLLAVAFLWWGPLSRMTRTGARRTLAAVAPGPVGALVVIVVALVAAVVLADRLLDAQPLSWWPAPTPTLPAP